MTYAAEASACFRRFFADRAWFLYAANAIKRSGARRPWKEGEKPRRLPDSEPTTMQALWLADASPLH